MFGISDWAFLVNETVAKQISDLVVERTVSTRPKTIPGFRRSGLQARLLCELA
jgi:hypothetical protein